MRATELLAKKKQIWSDILLLFIYLFGHQWESGGRTFQHHLICECFCLNYIRLGCCLTAKTTTPMIPGCLHDFFYLCFIERPLVGGTAGCVYKWKSETRTHKRGCLRGSGTAHPHLSIPKKKGKGKKNKPNISMDNRSSVTNLLSSVPWKKTTTGWLDLCS